MTFFFASSVQTLAEPDHGTIVKVDYEGLSYAAQFWTGSDKLVIVALPESDLRALSPLQPPRLWLRAFWRRSVSLCAFGPAALRINIRSAAGSHLGCAPNRC